MTRPSSQAHVLILCRRAVVLREVAAIAAGILATGQADVTIAVDRSLTGRLTNLVPEACRLVTLDGVPAVPEPVADGAVTPSPSRSRLRSTLLRQGPARSFAMLAKIWSDTRRARRLLSRTRPNAMILFDDRAAADMAMIKAARQARVRVVLAPYASSSPESDVAYRLKDAAAHGLHGMSSLLRRLIAKLFPHEVRETPHGAMLFFRASDYPALAAFRLLGGRSWLWGGGKADAVCVFGEPDRDTLVSEGVDPAKVHVTGQASLDLLFAQAARRNELKQEQARDTRDDRSLIVCAVPQSAEHGQLSWEAHERATLDLFDALQGSRARVMLSLHPRSERAYYERLAAGRPALSISSEPLETILPAADLFIATYSSTVRWAVLVGVPSLIIDPADLNYAMFDGMPGVSIVKEQAAWSSAIRTALADDTLRLALATDLEKSAGLLGPRDGVASQRIASLALAGQRPDQLRPV